MTTYTNVTLGEGPPSAPDDLERGDGARGGRPRGALRMLVVGALVVGVGVAVAFGGYREPRGLAPLGALAAAVERTGAVPEPGAQRTTSIHQVTYLRPVDAATTAAVVVRTSRDVTLDADGHGTVIETPLGYEFGSDRDRDLYLAGGWDLPQVGSTTTQVIDNGPSTIDIVAAAGTHDTLDAYLGRDDTGAGPEATRFANGVAALRETNLPADTRGALLRYLSEDRNVIQQAHVVDSLGRDSVTVVSVSDHTGMATRTTAWLDATTGDLLQEDVETLGATPVLTRRSVYTPG